MTTRTSILALAIASLALGASAAFAADVAQPETPGSEGPKAVAEARHLAKVHGIDNRAKQPEAQAAGSPAAQSAAETIHLKRQHGVVNDTADRRLELAHPNH